MKKNQAFSAITASLALLLSLSACTGHGAPAPAPSSTSSAPTSESASATPVTPGSATPSQPSIASGEPNPATPAGTALEALQKLPVQAASSTSPYKRANFGKAWDDVDHNGCDTRNDILKRDLKDTVIGSDCKVKKGTYADPYTGKTINFDSSTGGGGGIDIDHIVPLSLAWQTGASTWDDAKRLQYANDPLNLLSADSSENRKKGDKDASQYLPPNASFHCEYVARQVAVRAKYGTWVTPAEKGAIESVLKTCPDQKLPEGGPAVSASNPGTPAVVETVTPEPVAPAVQPAPAAGGNDPQFSSCAKAKAAGYGPYTAADPEFGWYKDGDGDGTVCE